MGTSCLIYKMTTRVEERQHRETKARHALIIALMTLEGCSYDLAMVYAMLAVLRLTELIDVDKVIKTIRGMTDYGGGGSSNG